MTTNLEWSGIEGVAFDAVGTLIDPYPSVAQAYADAAARQGVAVEPAEVKRRFHKFFRVDEVDEIRGPLATDEEVESRRWRRIVANVLPDLPDLDRAFAELWDHFGRPSAWRVFDDVPDMLASLRESGIPFVIASNFDGRLREVARGHSTLAECVDNLVISSEVGFRKPHPAFYQAVCKELGLSPSRVLYVGDDLENDVRGPERAGLRGLRVDRDSRAGGEAPSLAHLSGLVDRVLNARGGKRMGAVGR